jgi:hypothetical protein
MNRVFQSWWWWIDKQSTGGGDPDPEDQWILATNFWRDEGVWEDDDVWKD